MTTTFKRLRNIAAVALMTVASSSAFAGSVFTIDPNSNGLTNPAAGATQFEGTQLTGGSSARVFTTSTNPDGSYNYSSVGYIQFTGIMNGGTAVGTDDSALGSARNGYGLYATFTQNFTCGTTLQVGTSCAITSISLNLYADRGLTTTFTAATLTQNATATENGAGAILLGTVDTVIAGTAGFNYLGGAYQNVNTNFELTAAGSNFFIAPTPFYSFAYSAFTNTTLGLTCNPADCVGATVVAVNSETGTTDFNGVPEPMPLALMGLGMLGMVALRRKQAKK